MTAEAMQALSPKSGGRYIDATLGGGTHTAELLERSAPDGRVLSFDVDPEAIQRASERFRSFGKHWQGVEANFRNLARVSSDLDFAPVDGILIDLGVSSDELLDPTKGLSFQVAGPLDMRLGPKANEDGLTAADIVNSWRASEISDLLRDYGEERFAKKIAMYLVDARKHKRFNTTLDLAEAIRDAVPKGYEHGRIHPATRTFQALRIAVNDELNVLNAAIDGARAILKPGGILAIISFHSLEDRIVKQAFKAADDLEQTTKKPMVPSEEEQNRNPRSRSAKLRVARKVDSNQTKQKTKVWGLPTPSL